MIACGQRDMGTTTLVSVGEYLASDYEPDRDYVDGVLEERNRGETPHASLQALLAAWLVARRKPLGIWVTTEQRIHVGGTRFRVPDVCVVLGARPAERVLTQPPLLCLEILSPED